MAAEEAGPHAGAGRPAGLLVEVRSPTLPIFSSLRSKTVRPRQLSIVSRSCSGMSAIRVDALRAGLVLVGLAGRVLGRGAPRLGLLLGAAGALQMLVGLPL